MKKTAKQIIGLSLAAFSCSALAAVLPTFNVNTASATETNVFEIAEGAGIRTADPVGIRFIVKMSDDVKEKIVANNYQFGFVASREDQFDGVTDYVDMENGLKSESPTITSENVDDYIYEGTGEYAGYWCANVVINMGENDTVDEFVKRTYSAVAYYTDGTDYTYTENRQERSVQTVASKLYLSNDTDWNDVETVYENLGSANVPFLVAQSGKNSYETFVSRISADGNFGSEYAFKLEEGVTIDSKILDSTEATDIVTRSTNGTSMSTEITFDETVKYDSESNGSYKLSTKTANGLAAENNNHYWDIKPAQGRAYYKAMQKLGYTKLAIRFMIEDIDIVGNSNASMVYINTDKVDMDVYSGNEQVLDKNSYLFWNYEVAKIPTGEWAEMVFDISKFISNYGAEMPLLRIDVGVDRRFDLNMYIDNVYAVKGSIAETLETATTTYQNLNTEFDFSTLGTNENAISTATLDDKAVSVSDGKVNLSGYGEYTFKQTTRDTYGYIATKVVTKGTVAQNLATKFSAVHKDKDGEINYSAYKNENEQIVVSSNGAGNVDYIGMTTYKVETVGDKAYYESLQEAGYKYITYEYTFSYTGTIPTTVSMYRCGLVTKDTNHTNNLSYNSTAFPYTVSGDEGATLFNTETDKTSNKHFQSNSTHTAWNGKKFTVSIDIEDFINNYDTNGMRILALYFSAAATEMDYNVTFGRIAATKEACKF